MTTTIITRNTNNQLFETRKEAMEEIATNGYSIYKETTTMPCSFSEGQRLPFDLNRDDEMAINVFVIDTEDDEPMLIGYISDDIDEDESETTKYIYKGQQVVLLHEEDMANSGFDPVVRESVINPYAVTEDLIGYITRNDIAVGLTYDDCYSAPESGAEIVFAQVKNIENEQYLSSEWVTKDYAEWDKFEREYLDSTDEYYQWRSVRTMYIHSIEMADGDADKLAQLRQEWEAEVEAEKPAHNPYDFCQDLSWQRLADEATID